MGVSAKMSIASTAFSTAVALLPSLVAGQEHEPETIEHFQVFHVEWPRVEVPDQEAGLVGAVHYDVRGVEGRGGLRAGPDHHRGGGTACQDVRHRHPRHGLLHS